MAYEGNMELSILEPAEMFPAVAAFESFITDVGATSGMAGANGDDWNMVHGHLASLLER